MNLRDEARHYFNETLGLTYRDLRKQDLLQLRAILTQALQTYELHAVSGVFSLSPKFFQRYTADRTVKSAHFFIDSPYFEAGEGITFHEDGFIGFCGWASDEHLVPFVEAFKTWCDQLKSSKLKELN